MNTIRITACCLTAVTLTATTLPAQPAAQPPAWTTHAALTGLPVEDARRQLIGHVADFEALADGRLHWLVVKPLPKNRGANKVAARLPFGDFVFDSRKRSFRAKARPAKARSVASAVTTWKLAELRGLTVRTGAKARPFGVVSRLWLDATAGHIAFVGVTAKSKGGKSDERVAPWSVLRHTVQTGTRSFLAPVALASAPVMRGRLWTDPKFANRVREHFGIGAHLVSREPSS